jgi:hypothetical protein
MNASEWAESLRVCPDSLSRANPWTCHLNQTGVAHIPGCSRYFTICMLKLNKTSFEFLPHLLILILIISLIIVEHNL